MYSRSPKERKGTNEKHYLTKYQNNTKFEINLKELKQ